VEHLPKLQNTTAVGVSVRERNQTCRGRRRRVFAIEAESLKGGETALWDRICHRSVAEARSGLRLYDAGSAATQYSTAANRPAADDPEGQLSFRIVLQPVLLVEQVSDRSGWSASSACVSISRESYAASDDS